ncbi:putative mitotic checkpoint protein prcc protein [Botrytis fragariae]|uniref:Putative mitotic checkpoint protein prcc protein n=1 Tax=Botrytis fragariae TaxID=1964551 RepID=A0A8H6AQ85_9HELO|nr:putative mitotic checkpoint protein prcc protein [Botrytis fragariae]KAF5871489.1 putative mitotic checkpoint protein prcc protein [Botrytis fragariae]
MGLVDYSDSEDSDSPEITAPKPSTSTSTTGKPAFQKVVDRSNPGKIRVSLPQASLKDDTKTDEPPTKRAKTGGGAFSGFNSFLPAPKRTGQSTGATLGGGNAARKSGLGAGVSLKTGAAPAFSREPEPVQEREYTTEEPAEEEEGASGSGLNLPPPSSLVDEQKPADEVKLVGKPLMFRPLSVARKPAKKKLQKPNSNGSTPSTSTSTPQISTPATPQNTGKVAPKPKVSLFSLEVEPVNTTPNTTSNGEYKPLLYQPTPSKEEPVYEEYTPTTNHTLPFAPTPPVNNHNTESLSSIADTLHLSAAERRQLFGRQKGGGSGPQAATKIINFNTDQEYAHNEELRAAGEQVVHNPVRAIAPGKHSLKQLVGAAQSQREALEESFATGRNNRKEAGSKYGW